MTAHRELAERIASALFTNGNSDHATRLVLVAESARRSAVVSKAHDLGGWCESAVSGIIESHLAELDQPSRSARARMRTLLRATVDLASSWDEYGAIGPRAPLSWESVGRVAMDHAAAALRELDGLPPMIHQRVGLDDLAEDTMEEVAPIEQPDDQQPRPAALTEGGPSATPAGGLNQELSSLLNRHSAESGSNTPDFILAQYLLLCMDAFNHAVRSRESWYGRERGHRRLE